mgnify:CR=1 FL=1
MKKMALAAALAVSFSGGVFAAAETGAAAGAGASTAAAGTATTVAVRKQHKLDCTLPLFREESPS